MLDNYNVIYKKSIDYNKGKLIDAFVKYYGEEYRNKITNSINSIIFTWFRHRFLDEFYSKYKRYSYDIRCVLKYDINQVVGSTLDVSEYENQIKDILNESNYNFASNTTFFKDNIIIEIINLPMFITNDRILIHEVNHVVVCENLFYVEENNKKFLVRKDGLEVDTKYSLIEEIINELSARDITNIFYKLGGSIFGKKLEVGNDSEKLFLVVEPFYIKYKDLLKRVRMSLNYNEIFKYIDEDTYNKYVSFINKLFSIKREYDKNNKKFVIKKKVIDIANKYINNMEKESVKKLKLV